MSAIVWMFKLVLEKAEEPEIKLPTSAGSWKKQENSRKTSISALLTMPKLLTVWITTNWKILKELGIPDHLTCLLRNLYAGQEGPRDQASGPITSWEIDGETVETVSDFIFWGSKITADGDCSHEIKRHLLLGRKVMTSYEQLELDMEQQTGSI